MTPRVIGYKHTLGPAEQITTEEQIADVIFDYSQNAAEDRDVPPCLGEDDCAELGRHILRTVLGRFRPDLCEFADATAGYLPTTWADLAVGDVVYINGNDGAGNTVIHGPFTVQNMFFCWLINALGASFTHRGNNLLVKED